TYVFFEVPSNIVLIKIKPSIWISSLMVGWGIVMISMAFVKNYHQLLVTRLLLGCFEAGLFPGVIYYITKWYKRSEQSYRVGLFFAGCMIAGAFSGLLAYAIMGMDGRFGLSSWQWIFLIDGLATVFVAFFAYFLISDFPETATWLKEDERKIIIDRLQNDLGDITTNDLDKHQIYEAFKDWVPLFIQFTAAIPGYSYSFFIPSIVNGLGFNPVISQLLSVPPFILGCLTMIMISILSDRSGVRGPYLICNSLVAIVGYILLVIPTSGIAIKYIGLCIVCMGLSSCVPVSITWLTNNLAGNSKRAVGSAIIIACGNIAGIPASQLYQPQDAPAYKFGHVTVIFLLLFTITLSIVQYSLLNRANKLKIKYPERFLKGKSKEEAVILGDKHPSFVYCL
ncbi:3559_t:CDS:2, partial [Scutellospora calospora]